MSPKNIPKGQCLSNCWNDCYLFRLLEIALVIRPQVEPLPCGLFGKYF